MAENRNTFGKNEKLCSDKIISDLFARGESFVKYPLRVVYLTDAPVSDGGCRILVSVSKRKFKRAVKRNRVKRLIREAYRLNKQILAEAVGDDVAKVVIAFMHINDGLPTFAQIEKAMVKSLAQISDNILNSKCL